MQKPHGISLYLSREVELPVGVAPIAAVSRTSSITQPQKAGCLEERIVFEMWHGAQSHIDVLHLDSIPDAIAKAIKVKEAGWQTGYRSQMRRGPKHVQAGHADAPRANTQRLRWNVPRVRSLLPPRENEA
jgi:hypothetical protein